MHPRLLNGIVIGRAPDRSTEDITAIAATSVTRNGQVGCGMLRLGFFWVDASRLTPSLGIGPRRQKKYPFTIARIETIIPIDVAIGSQPTQ